jgi:hypothetical protein
MNKKPTLTIIMISALLVSLMAGLQVVEAQLLSASDAQISDIPIIKASNTMAGQSVTLSVILSDPLQTQRYYFAWNNAGSWISQEPTNVTAKLITFNGTWSNSATNVEVKLNLQDNFGNWRMLPQQSFTLTYPYPTPTPTPNPTNILTSIAQQQALAFIENVLPVDLTKYNLTFNKSSTLDGTVIDLHYSLDSEDNTIDVTCRVEKNVLTNCHIYPMNGSVISERQYVSLFDAVKSFVEKYQTYSKTDSTNLIAMLDNVDLTKNTTTIVGDTKLIISNNVFGGEEKTYLKWANTVNGADYTLLQLGFLKDGSFEYFMDERAICTIVDTSVNISREQAIEKALKNLSFYSYEMPDHSFVSDFNVTKDKISAELAISRANYELRPYWDIRMPLNQTYPGSVHGITVFIWANNGEIISYSNIAYGGIEYNDNSDPNATINPEPTISPTTSTQQPTLNPTQTASPTASPNVDYALNLLPLILCITALVIVAVTVNLLFYFKKRK